MNKYVIGYTATNGPGQINFDGTNEKMQLESTEGRLKWVPLDEVMDKEMPLTAKFMLEHYLSVGQFDDTVYSGATCEDHMEFTKLEEF